MKIEKHSRRVWVLRIEEHHDDMKRPEVTYLHHVPGDCGPSHTAREELEGALEFDSRCDASRWATEHCRGLGWATTPIEVEVKTTYKVL